LENIPRQFFTNEFKEEAVKLVVNGGLSVAEESRRLSISSQTLKNWVTKHRAGVWLVLVADLSVSWKQKFPNFAKNLPRYEGRGWALLLSGENYWPHQAWPGAVSSTYLPSQFFVYDNDCHAYHGGMIR
jgi:hypothetical protein